MLKKWMQVILAVLSAFIGIRSRQQLAKDFSSLKWWQVLIMALVCVVLLIIILIKFVSYVVSS